MTFENSSDSRCLVFVPYLDHWQWVFASEYALEQKSRGKEVKIVAMEIVNLRGLINIFSRKFHVASINHKVFHLLKESGIELSWVNVFPRFTIRNVKISSDSKFLQSDKYQEIAYPNLIDSLGRMRIDPTRDKKTILKFGREAEAITRALKKMKYNRPGEVATPSGRFCRNKAVVTFFKEMNGSTVRVLDSSSHGHYEVVSDGQSITEFSDLVYKNWVNSCDLDKLEIGANYFEARIRSARSRNDYWTHRMNVGELPKLNPNKKVCVFYSTTQIEFEGSGDLPSATEFQSQVDAIAHLRRKLPMDQWELVVRRHPWPAGVTHSDRDLLEGLTDIQGLVIVEGNSQVDSYALGDRADLIFHFGSTIGAEFTFLGGKPVYSLRKTYWWRFDEGHHLVTKNDLEDLNLEALSVADPLSVIPWGYYISRGGFPIKHLQEVRGEWTLSGIQIKGKSQLTRDTLKKWRYSKAGSAK